MKFQSIIALVALFFLNACASGPIYEGQDLPVAEKATPERIDFVFAHNRYLEMEPCGCSLGPMGGLDREMNLIQKWKKGANGPMFYFSSGTHFTQEPKLFISKNIPTYRVKSEFMVRGLNTLGVNVISPSAEDFALGADWIAHLKKMAKFKMVSANLLDTKASQLAFPAYVTYQFDDLELVITGVSSQPHSTYGDLAVEVLDPAESVQNLIQSLPQRKRIVVVLSQLDKKARGNLQSQLSQSAIVFGSNRDGFTRQLLQRSGSQIHLAPLSLGRQLAKLSLVPAKGNLFYVPAIAPILEFSKKQMEEIVAQPDLSAKERTRVTSQIAQLADIPLRSSDQFHTVTTELQLLDGDWKKPTNSLTKLLSEMHEAIRKKSLEASRSRRRP